MTFMKMMSVCVLVLVVAGPARSETLVLQDGQTLSAQILKSDDRQVILDLGFDVLRIPKANIRQILDPSKAGADPNAGTQARSELRGLYHTIAAAPTTIEKNAEQFAEAVVMVTSPAGQGSGFILNEQGHLITNYHVIANETLIKVTVFHKVGTGFEQNIYKKVKIMAFNPFVDLALLKIEEADSPFKYVYLGQMDRLSTGQTCFAIGNPLGLTRTVSQGIVSSTNRNYDGRLYIQTTTDINPGNSGGPLFNLQGQVIGVTSMGYLFLGGLNFAIPVDVVQRFVENWDAFAYNEDSPNAGYRYLQPIGRTDSKRPPAAKLPADLD